MAGHLLRNLQESGSPNSGEFYVWNRTPSKAEELQKSGAKVAESLEELATHSQVILTCVGTSQDAIEVIEILSAAAAPGTLFIDHSTIEPAAAVHISEQILKPRQQRFVDAPITGGSMGAQAGTLTVFLGGSVDDVAEAIEVIQPFSKRAERVGDVGLGQTMKLANQIAVGGALIGLCESLAFATRSGLDLDQAHSMIGSGAGGSWAFANYGPKILARDWTPGFSIKNQTKDFGYCETAATELGIEIPMTQLVHRLLNELKEAGFGEETTAALYRSYLEPLS